MNKLNTLIASAAKLAAQQPNDGEALDWNGAALGRAVKAWYAETLPESGTCLPIDVPDTALQPPLRSGAPAWLVRTSPPEAGSPDMPADWHCSQRLPSDLATREADLLQRLQSAGSMLEVQQALLEQTGAGPWIADGSIQRVLAPFLLNGSGGSQRDMALAEIGRVLAAGGCFDTFVLAADEPLSGARITCEGHACLAFPKEDEAAGLLVAAGCHGATLTPLLDRPCMIVDGAELRAFAVRAYTGTKGICLEQGDAAVYLGPWSKVEDDDGHTYPRGTRIAVCAKTAAVLQRPPYAGSFEIIPAYECPPLDQAEPFDCSQNVVRPAAETKGLAPLGSSGSNRTGGTGADCGC